MGGASVGAAAPPCPGLATSAAPLPNKNTVVVLCPLVVPVLTSANPVPMDKRQRQLVCVELTESE